LASGQDIITSVGIPVLILLVIGGGIVVFLILWGALLSVQKGKDQFEEACRRVAQRLGGTVEGGAIRFQSCGRTSRIEFAVAGPDGIPGTGVEMDVRGRSPGVLTIFPEGFGAAFLKFFGVQDVVVGDRDFDALYMVKSNPESLAHHLFSPERRARVVACVRSLSPYGSVLFDLGLNRLVVRVGAGLRREHEILSLAGAATEFLGYILETEAPGDIRWLESPEGKGGQCQVCGTEMRDRIVLCARCRTPHHEECWLYLGECSTFACKERRYVSGGRTFRAPERRQTPDEWLRGEVDRDRREMSRREAEEAVRRFERRQRERGG
jgi:hypothetical protein